jgi:hypothetical protein
MLPTIDMKFCPVDHSGWFGDINLKEMFKNFTFNIDLYHYVGIAATEL